MKKRGQIWVETVIYTLIAFVMIGLVLAYAKPKIEELQDKLIIEQSIALVKNIDSTILTMGGPGNQRILEIGIKKGTLTFNGEKDSLIFEMDSKYQYSEPKINISDGNLIILTEKKGENYKITLTRDFEKNYNITYNGKSESKSLGKSATTYKISISVSSPDSEETRNIIDIKVI